MKEKNLFLCSRWRKSKGPRWSSSSLMLPGSALTLETSTPSWPSSVSLILPFQRYSLAWPGINSAFSPTAGMNMSPVSRLKKTWSKAKTAKFFILEVNMIQQFSGWDVWDGWKLEADSSLLVAVCSDSIRWIPLGISTTTGRPWGGPPIALGPPTATENGYGSAPHCCCFSQLAGSGSILYYIFVSVFSITALVLPQIVIPFFSLLIKDIYFLNEGCANRLPNGHVNFEVRLPHIS